MRKFKLDEEVRGFFGGTGETFRQALDAGKGKLERAYHERPPYRDYELVLNGVHYRIDNRQIKKYLKKGKK